MPVKLISSRFEKNNQLYVSYSVFAKDPRYAKYLIFWVVYPNLSEYAHCT